MKNKHSNTITLVTAVCTLLLFGACGNKNETPQPSVASHTYSVSSWNWMAPHYYTDLSVPELTSANLNSAGVQVYYSADPGTWISIPYTIYGTVSDYHIGFLYDAGTVSVTWLYDGVSTGSDPNAYYGTTVQCKVVVVSSSARLANPDLDWNNYGAVKSRFNLAD